MDYSDTLDALNIQLGDSGNITFTPEEKARALQKAWNDSFVVKTVWDATTIWAVNTFSYVMPATMDAVKDIYVNRNVDSGNEPIAADLWEVIDGNMKFRTATNRIFTVGNIVYVKGNYKFDWNTDTLPTTNLQEYVLASAGFNTISLLKYKKANLFLKNDTTVSELIGLGREFDTERKELRGKLLREVQGA